MQAKSLYKSNADRIGIAASLICSVHCVALPAFFTTVPFLGIEILENSIIEVATILVSMCAGGWAIVRGYRLYHKNKMILSFFIAGLALMIAGNFVPYEWEDMTLKFIGGLMVVIAHLRNWKSSKHCIMCNEEKV